MWWLGRVLPQDGEMEWEIEKEGVEDERRGGGPGRGGGVVEGEGWWGGVGDQLWLREIGHPLTPFLAMIKLASPHQRCHVTNDLLHIFSLSPAFCLLLVILPDNVERPIKHLEVHGPIGAAILFSRHILLIKCGTALSQTQTNYADIYSD